MSRKFRDYEYDDYDAEDYSRGRKLNKNARRSQRLARNEDRYSSFEDNNTEKYSSIEDYDY